MSRPGEREFTRLLPVDGLEAEGRAFRIEAGIGERKGLAERFGLISVDYLAADGRIAAEPNRDLLRLEGRLVADVVQSCVVTLAPVSSRIDVTFERCYGTGVATEETGEGGAVRDVHLTLADELPPEPLSGGAIDVGAAIAEQLALELNPFPRVTGAVFEGLPDAAEQTSEGEKPGGPFAALAALRRKSGDAP